LFVTENEGAMKLAEGKVCEVKLYDSYCDQYCSSDCQKTYGPKAFGFCIIRACMCRRLC